MSGTENKYRANFGSKVIEQLLELDSELVFFFFLVFVFFFFFFSVVFIEVLKDIVILENKEFSELFELLFSELLVRVLISSFLSLFFALRFEYFFLLLCLLGILITGSTSCRRKTPTG